MNALITNAACLILVTLSPQTLAQHSEPDPSKAVVRVATFNVSFNRPKSGKLAKDLANNDQQAVKVSRIIRTIQPDILLLNEFDFDAAHLSLKIFQGDYLQSDILDPSLAKAVYPFSYTNVVNTGVASGMDIDGNGKIGGGGDSFGFGQFPGQYGMVVLSKYPIMTKEVRTFQNLLWHKIPNPATPIFKDGQSWYSESVWKAMRISSKSHWDIPINVNGKVIHLLASHPTPPAFDGPEDRNGKRNHDEIKLWAEYLTNKNTDWLTDDSGNAGGLEQSETFVIVGDLNADPADGGSNNRAIQQLLGHPRVNSQFTPGSVGAVRASSNQKKANLNHTGNPEFDTADFSDRVVGNLRADYVLPSTQLEVNAGAVVWPVAGHPLFDDIDCTDHRMVWLDLSWK